MINVQAAWIGIFLGCLSGAIQGLFFDREKWLGGYGSWPRRMVRLGHISFFGIGILNLVFAASNELAGGSALSPWLLITAAVTMPAICYLSAWRAAFRRLFFIPTLSLMSAAGIVAWRLVTL